MVQELEAAAASSARAHAHRLPMERGTVTIPSEEFALKSWTEGERLWLQVWQHIPESRHLEQGHGFAAMALLWGEDWELAWTQLCPSQGFLYEQGVFLLPSSSCAALHHLPSHRAISCWFRGCASTWGQCVRAKHCLCIPHCSVSHLYPSPAASEFAASSWQAALHDLLVLSCTSDTLILGLISPRCVSSAAIASAWHLQAPGSLSPKDRLQARHWSSDQGFIRLPGKGCYSELLTNSIFLFLCNCWASVRKQNCPWDGKMELNLPANTRKWILTSLLTTKCFMLRNW